METERIRIMKMRVSIFAIWAIILLGLTGCEKAADISSPKQYENDNISFSYPRNWKVTEDIAEQNFRYLIIESPGDAIFIVQIHEKNDAASLREFAKFFSSQVKEEALTLLNIPDSSFKDIEVTTFSTSIRGIRESVSVSLLGQNIPHVRDFYMKESSDNIAYLIGQVATEDLNKVEPGFNLILSSFNLE